MRIGCIFASRFFYKEGSRFFVTRGRMLSPHGINTKFKVLHLNSFITMKGALYNRVNS